MENRKVIKPQLVKRRHSFPSVGVRHDITTCLPLDRDSTYDLMQEIFRHPVLASDSRKYEATTFLSLLKRGGKSPFIPNHTFDQVIYDLQLKVDLDKFYGEHKDRCANYDVAPVMEEIHNWMKLYNDKSDPIDLEAQHQFLPDDDDELGVENQMPVVHREVDVPQRRTFMGALLGRYGLYRACCFPPVSFWSRRLDEPVLNLMANTFIVSEVALLFYALPHMMRSDEILYDVGRIMIPSLFFSTMFAMISASVAGFCMVMEYEEGDVERLHM